MRKSIGIDKIAENTPGKSGKKYLNKFLMVTHFILFDNIFHFFVASDAMFTVQCYRSPEGPHSYISDIFIVSRIITQRQNIVERIFDNSLRSISWWKKPSNYPISYEFSFLFTFCEPTESYLLKVPENDLLKTWIQIWPMNFNIFEDVANGAWNACTA